MNKVKPEFLNYHEVASAEFKQRVEDIKKEFIFAGYKWKLRDQLPELRISLNQAPDKETEEKIKSQTLMYDLTLIDEDNKVDLLSQECLMNKRNTYRQYVEAMFSFMYDITILDLRFQLIEATKFVATIVYARGVNLVKTASRAYTRQSRASCYPLTTATENFKGTLFPLIDSIQYSSGRGLNKGMLVCRYTYDPTGDPVSTHYTADSFKHGIPVMSIMLTENEYKTLRKSAIYYEGLAVVKDYNKVIDIIGTGDEFIGSFLLGLSILVDAHSVTEHWTFNMAYETDNTITCIRRFRVEVPKGNKSALLITVTSSIIGILSEGLEAIITMDPNNMESDYEANIDVTFCNGINSENIHKKNVEQMERIIFENLFSDTCTFGWKLGEEDGDLFEGLLCIPIATNHREYTDSNYVKKAKIMVKYRPYFICPNSAFAAICKFRKYHKHLFGGKIGLDRFMYPIDSIDNMTIYKSYGKMPNKKYRFMTLISTKDYEPNQTSFDILNQILGAKQGLQHYDPLKDEFIYNMILSMCRKYFDIEDGKVAYSFVGSRLIALESTGFQG